MKAKYQTLDDLDAIKEQAAEKTRDMTAEPFVAHFAGAERRLHEVVGQPTRRTRVGRKTSTGKR